MSSGSTVIDIASPAEFHQYVSSFPEALLVIYFHASWAEPCKHMSTAISALASTYPATQPPKILFLRIDADEVSDIAEQYEIASVPHVVLQKNGAVVEVVSSPNIAAVRATVEKHAGSADNSGARFGLPPVQQVQKTEQQSKAPAANAPPAGETQQPTESKEDLNARLGELVKAAPVMLFMKGTPSAPQCGFSRQTVALLREKGIRYGFFNILADDDVRQGLKEFSDWPTFPQVYCDGELVGGLDILREEFENDPDFMKDYSVTAKNGA